MLHKFGIMLLIIKNMKMVLNQNARIFIIRICMKIVPKCDMHKNINMECVPMHGLNFILGLKTVIFSKIHN